MLKSRLRIGLAMMFMMICSVAQATDTTETFDVGATDFEFYMGLDGVGLSKYNGTIAGEALVGYGFMDRFSGYLTAAGEFQ